MFAAELPAGIDGDAGLEAPPYPSASPLVRVETGRRFTVWRAELSFWKLDGREIGGWMVDFYLPTESNRARARSSRQDPGPGLSSGGTPLVVVLPVGRLGKGLSSSFARKLVEHRFVVLELKRPPAGAEGSVLHSLEGTARTLTEEAANLRRVIGWAQRLAHLGPERIGIFAVSRGAIAAALVAQSEPRLSTVLVIGGADLAGLFRESRMAIVERMRRQEIERAGGDLDRAAARAALVLGNVDPATRRGRLDPARTLLINARWDHVMPRHQALALRAAAGGATQAWIPSGHYGSLLFAGSVRRLALKHFRDTLEPR